MAVSVPGFREQRPEACLGLAGILGQVLSFSKPQAPYLKKWVWLAWARAFRQLREDFDLPLPGGGKRGEPGCWAPPIPVPTPLSSPTLSGRFHLKRCQQLKENTEMPSQGFPESFSGAGAGVSSTAAGLPPALRQGPHWHELASLQEAEGVQILQFLSSPSLEHPAPPCSTPRGLPSPESGRREASPVSARTQGYVTFGMLLNLSK